MIGLDITHKALFTRGARRPAARHGRGGQGGRRALRLLPEFHQPRYRFDGSPIHDAMAVAHVIDPTLVTTLQLQRRDRDGVGVLRRPHGRRPLARHATGRANAHAGIDVDADRFLELLVERISSLA